MGYNHREISKIRSLGKFICAPREDEETGHLPITPVANDEPWRQFGQGVADLAVMLPSSGRYCPPEMHVAMAMLQYPPGMRTVPIALKGVRRDNARREMTLKARELGCVYGVMFDDDNPPPSDCILKLLKVLDDTPSAGIAAGIYVNRGFPLLPFVFKFKDNPEGFYFDWKAELRDETGKVTREGEVFECDAIATGCMMVRMSVFDDLPEPWFYECHTLEEADRYYKTYSYPPPRKYVIEPTDDMWFCGRVQEAGWKIMAHGGVLPGHWDGEGNCFRLAEDSLPMQL